LQSALGRSAASLKDAEEASDLEANGESAGVSESIESNKCDCEKLRGFNIQKRNEFLFVIECATFNALTRHKNAETWFNCGIWDSLRGCNSEFSNLNFVAFRLLWNVNTTPTKVFFTSSQRYHSSLGYKRGEKFPTWRFRWSPHSSISNSRHDIVWSLVDAVWRFLLSSQEKIKAFGEHSNFDE